MRKGVKVRRVVRRFELWPVAKVAFFFHVLCYLLTLGILTGVWFVADRMGTIENLERLITRLGWDEFVVHGDVLFRAAALIGASLVVVATIATVTLAFFYNMLSGIFGGLVLSVLQEHTEPGSGRSRRSRRAKNEQAKNEQAKNEQKRAEAGLVQQPEVFAAPSGPDTQLEPQLSNAAQQSRVPQPAPPSRPAGAPALHPPLRPKAPVAEEFLDDDDLEDDTTWSTHLRPRKSGVGS